MSILLLRGRHCWGAPSNYAIENLLEFRLFTVDRDDLVGHFCSSCCCSLHFYGKILGDIYFCFLQLPNKLNLLHIEIPNLRDSLCVLFFLLLYFALVLVIAKL